MLSRLKVFHSCGYMIVGLLSRLVRVGRSSRSVEGGVSDGGGGIPIDEKTAERGKKTLKGRVG